ncbi:hypothetical protein ACHAPT_009768 [Fusarium lateritium]
MPISPSAMAKHPPKVGLGVLDRLPVEVLDRIISVLDIAAVNRFKAVNKRAFQAEVLRGFYAIKLATTITVETLVAKLSKSRCVECGDFGGYMYLMTLERVCAWCVRKTDRFAVVRELAALTKFGLAPKSLGSILQFESFPAKKYGDGPEAGHYEPLFDRESVLKASMARHGSEEAMRKFHAEMGPDVIESYKKNIRDRERVHDEARFRKRRALEIRHRAYTRKRVAAKKVERERRERENIQLTWGDEDYPSTDPDVDAWSDLEPEEDAMPKALQAVEEERDYRDSCRDTYTRIMAGKTDDLSYHPDKEPLRSAALLRVPWLNMQTRRAEWGFYCIGCLHGRRLHNPTRMDSDKPTYFRRDFLVSTFEQHLEDFGPIRNGLHHTDECCERRICNQKRRHCYCPECTGDRERIEHKDYWKA